MFNLGFFTDFNPLKGPLPKISPVSWSRIVDEAREILRGRTSRQIKAAHSSLHLVLSSEGWKRHLELNEVVREKGIVTYYPSPVILLNRCRKYVELDEIKSFPGARWGEIYAVQALSLAGQSLSSERDPFPGTTVTSDEHHRRQERFAAELMLEAMELLTWAQAIQHFEQKVDEIASERIKIKISEIGRKGTDKRFAPLRAFKARAKSFWRAWPGTNKSEGAREFWRRQSPTDKDLINGARAQRTITDWFREADRERSE